MIAGRPRTPGGSIPGQVGLARRCAPGRLRTTNAWFVPFRTRLAPAGGRGRPVPDRHRCEGVPARTRRL